MQLFFFITLTSRLYRHWKPAMTNVKFQRIDADLTDAFKEEGR